MSRLPRLAGVVIAEQTRPEGGGKSALLGYCGLSPDVQLYIAEFPRLLDLAFLFQFHKATETAVFNFELEIDGPGPSSLMKFAAPEPLETKTGSPSAYVVNFRQLPLQTPGDYSVRLTTAGLESVEARFQIIRGTGPAVT